MNHNPKLVIESFRAGKEEGFNYFFNTYYKVIYFFACRYIKDKQQAEDMVEEGFIKLWENREKIETESGLRGYLYTTVYHACLRSLENEVRKERVYKVYKVEKMTNAEEDKGAMENMIKAETLRLVKEAVERLPGECRKVFMKLFVEGKSVAETAEELKVAISTVKNQKARGIKLLKAKLVT